MRTAENPIAVLLRGEDSAGEPAPPEPDDARPFTEILGPAIAGK
jgi:hypothetical protein